jgi:PleD family two-component response regulator
MDFYVEVSQRTMFTTLPLIAIYMLALSVLTDNIAVKLRNKSRELERIAMMDPLLDIANRRLLEKRIQYELDKLRELPRNSMLMFIDIDNFKEERSVWSQSGRRAAGHSVEDSACRDAKTIPRRAWGMNS